MMSLQFWCNLRCAITYPFSVFMKNFGPFCPHLLPLSLSSFPSLLSHVQWSSCLHRSSSSSGLYPPSKCSFARSLACQGGWAEDAARGQQANDDEDEQKTQCEDNKQMTTTMRGGRAVATTRGWRVDDDGDARKMGGPPTARGRRLDMASTDPRTKARA